MVTGLDHFVAHLNCARPMVRRTSEPKRLRLTHINWLGRIRHLDPVEVAKRTACRVWGRGHLALPIIERQSFEMGLGREGRS